jgi:hypothetical protein
LRRGEGEQQHVELSRRRRKKKLFSILSFLPLSLSPPVAVADLDLISKKEKDQEETRDIFCCCLFDNSYSEK